MKVGDKVGLYGSVGAGEGRWEVIDLLPSTPGYVKLVGGPDRKTIVVATAGVIHD